MNNAIVWARVSTEEQRNKGYSIDEQVKFCSDYAKKNSLTIIKEFHVSESGGYDSKKMSRKTRVKFQEMLNFVLNNDYPLIIAKERDRLLRSQEDNMLIRRLQREHPFQIAFALTGQTLSSEISPEKRLAHDIEIQFHDFTLLKIQEKTRAGLKEKANQGWYPCFAPIGYKNHKISNDKRDRKGNIIIVDAEHKNTPITLFNLYATGNYSFDSLMDEMNKRGYTNRYGKPVSKRLVQSTLKNPFYTGVFRYKGELFDGNHKPLIDKSLFDKVQEIMGNNLNSKIRTKRHFTYRRILKCSNCGRALVGEIQKGAHNSGRYVYYRRHKKECENLVDEKVLDKIFFREMDKLKIDKDTKKWAIMILRDSIKESKEKIHSRLYHLKSEEKKIINRKDILLNTLLDHLVEGGGFTTDEIKAKANRLQNQLTDIRHQIKRLESESDDYVDQGIALLNLVGDVKKKFLAMDIEQRANLLNILFRKCPVEDGKIRVNWRPPFSYISTLCNMTNKG